MIQHLAPGKILYLNAVARVILPSLFCLVASVQPIHIGAGELASEGYRPDLLQDVPDQGHHMLTSGSHVPGLASGSDWKIGSIQPFLLP